MSDDWRNNWKQYLDYPRVEDAVTFNKCESPAERAAAVDRQIAEWLLAEYRYHLVIQEWLLSEQRYLRWLEQRTLLDMATQLKNWENWSRAGELEPQEANDIYRWLIREAQWEASQNYNKGYEVGRRNG